MMFVASSKYLLVCEENAVFYHQLFLHLHPVGMLVISSRFSPRH